MTEPVQAPGMRITRAGCDLMSSFVFMKILESTPERYDLGIEILSRGRIRDVYESISSSVSGQGRKVLDVGCGTGNLSIACALKGASVTGIDINAGMLEVARRKAAEKNLEGNLTLIEIGVAELERHFQKEEFDSCVSCLAFSELTHDEQNFAISSIYRLLKPGGTLMIADEVIPLGRASRILRSLSHLPARLLAYVVAQSTTRPVENLEQLLLDAGFEVLRTERIWRDSFIVVKAVKGEHNAD